MENDRLMDYMKRMDDASHVRPLPDGCDECGRSAVYCRCVAWIEGGTSACCSSCTH